MNPIVGNQGIKWKYGGFAVEDPSGFFFYQLNDEERVSAHLEFALDQVKRNNSSTMNEARTKTVVALSDYIVAGTFPHHEDETARDQRLPCFIDSRGTPCAVAYLMHVSGHADLAKEVNSCHKHATIAEIVVSCQDDSNNTNKNNTLCEKVVSWQAQSGLTLQELALIQPTYDFAGARGRSYEFELVLAESRDMFKTIMEALVEEAARIRQGTDTDISDEFNAKMQEKIREFAVIFRNGNISEHEGVGWTSTEIAAFKKQIDQFESNNLPEGDCRKLRLLLVTLLAQSRWE